MKITKNTFVSLHYVLNVEGNIADQSMPEKPLQFVFGHGYLLPEFEKNIEGLSAGDKFEFTLTPEVGYGVTNPQMVIDVPKDAFIVNGQIESGLLEVGNEIPMMTSDGHQLLGRVSEVGSDSVKMDFNHPMAGKTLDFTGEIVDVREATEEDLNPHGEGCSCGDCSCDDGCDCSDDDECHCHCSDN